VPRAGAVNAVCDDNFLGCLEVIERSFAAVVSIGGSFSLLLASAVSLFSQPLSNDSFAVFLICLFSIVGILAGTASLERRAYGDRLLVMFLWCQVPVLHSYALTWEFSVAGFYHAIIRELPFIDVSVTPLTIRTMWE
jgi:hypothetical protein